MITKKSSSSSNPSNQGSDNGMENSLPKGWSETELNKIVSYKKGKKPAILQSNSFPDSLPYLDIKAVEKEIYYQYADIRSSNISNGDEIFVVWDGARSGWVGKAIKGAIGSTLMALLPKEINREYLFRFLQTQFDYINSHPRGTGIPHVDPELFWNIKVPIAPLTEQHRIVTKLDAILARVNNCKTRLDKIPKLLKNFRQSVLSVAVSGELTREWREKNKKVTGVNKLMNSKKQDFKINTDFKDLSQIPESWKWVALGSYTKCSRGRFSIRPRNDPRYFDGKYPFIQIGDLPREGGLVKTHYQTLNDDGFKVSKLFNKNTVAIAIVGATIGNTGILSYDMCFTDSIVGIETGTVSSNFFVDYYLRSEKENFRQLSYAGGGQPNIKLETINNYPFPLPPLEEQEEIVRKVEELFAYADTIENRYQKAKAWFDKLPQAILAKAFRGELVPQKENDEPARLLLERIKKDKQQSTKSKTKTTSKPKKMYEENDG